MQVAPPGPTWKAMIAASVVFCHSFLISFCRGAEHVMANPNGSCNCGCSRLRHGGRSAKRNG